MKKQLFVLLFGLMLPALSTASVTTAEIVQDTPQAFTVNPMQAAAEGGAKKSYGLLTKEFVKTISSGKAGDMNGFYRGIERYITAEEKEFIKLALLRRIVIASYLLDKRSLAYSSRPWGLAITVPGGLGSVAFGAFCLRYNHEFFILGGLAVSAGSLLTSLAYRLINYNSARGYAVELKRLYALKDYIESTTATA
jgi:hypothetical protein